MWLDGVIDAVAFWLLATDFANDRHPFFDLGQHAQIRGGLVRRVAFRLPGEIFPMNSIDLFLVLSSPGDAVRDDSVSRDDRTAESVVQTHADDVVLDFGRTCYDGWAFRDRT